VAVRPFGREVRGAWHLDPRVKYLNHGSFGACPKVVLEAQDAFRLRMEREPVAFLVDELPALLRGAAASIGEFCGVPGDGVVFVDNATAGANAVLASLRLVPGDEILCSDHGYNAVKQTALHKCREGCRLVQAKIPFPIHDPSEVVAAFEAAMSAHTRLVIVDHITSFSGLILPVEEIIALCRRWDVPVLVDGAHVPGQLDVDIVALNPDFYVGNAHKWLFAPKGCALLYAAPRWRDILHPTVISHGYGGGWLAEFDWTGTKDPSPWLALDAAIAFVDSFGRERLRAHNNALCAEAAEHLAGRWDVPIPSPAGMRAAMCTLSLPFPTAGTQAEVDRIRRTLVDKHGIEVPLMAWGGRTWLRISAQAYNSLDEYHALGDVIAGD
jgi:isopenicillin-N epimerase